MKKFPNIIPVFPLSGVIYFPKTNLPLNIFEQRYLNLINDAYNNDKLMGMVQSKKESETVFHEQELFDMKPIDCPRGAFFTPIIEKYINDTLHYQYDIRFTFKHIDFFIHIVFQGKIHIQKYIDYIKWIICLCLCEAMKPVLSTGCKANEVCASQCFQCRSASVDFAHLCL